MTSNTIPPDPPPPDAPEPVATLTPEQAQQIAQTLYAPYLNRMGILLQSLINMTSNGDFVLWAPIKVLEQQLLTMRWPITRPDASERLLSLIELAFRRMTEKIEIYRMERAAARAAGAPMPPLFLWTDDDTITAYDEIEARYPLPKAAAAAETAPGPGDGPDGPMPEVGADVPPVGGE